MCKQSDLDYRQGYQVQCNSVDANRKSMEPIPYFCILHALMAQRDLGQNLGLEFQCPQGLSNEQLLKIEAFETRAAKINLQFS